MIVVAGGDPVRSQDNTSGKNADFVNAVGRVADGTGLAVEFRNVRIREIKDTSSK